MKKQRPLRIPFALAGIALAGSLFATVVPAQAAQPGIVMAQSSNHGHAMPAPPPPRHEAVPRARRGQVWSPGHWEWRGHRYVWTAGTWVKARPGYRYREPQWVEHDGRWELRRGGWDRDGDGISNRNDRDRDGDGVRNRDDRRPDNPNRQ